MKFLIQNFKSPKVILIVIGLAVFIFAEIMFYNYSNYLSTLLLPSTIYKDRCAFNVEKFFNKINLDYPGLELVKQAVNNDNYERAKQEFINYMKQRMQPEYFFDRHNKNEIIQVFIEKYPDKKDYYIKASDSYLTHVFTFSGGTRNLGENIDWKQGANEWAAHLNRMYYLSDLGKSYWFTGNENYAQEFVFLIEDWIKDNPMLILPNRSLGEPWRTLETGVRSDVWIESYQYFIDSPSFSTDSQIRFLNSISEHAEYLYKAEEHYKEGNWQIVESNGLAAIGIMFPEFKNANQWKDRSYQRLNEHLQDDTYDDGGHKELVPRYHRWVTEMYLESMRLAQMNNYNSGFDINKYKKMYEWMLKIQEPNQLTPEIGDAQFLSIKYLMSVGAFLFNDSSMKYFAEDFLPEDIFWLFGKDAFDRYNLVPKIKPNFTSLKLSDSQFIMMRTGWRVKDEYLLFDCASHGGGHSHSDALNFILYSGGQEIIMDSGVCNYDDPLYKSYYKLSKAHNVIVVDGKDEFPPPSHEKPIINKWITSSDFDFASGSYTLQSNNLHTRKIFFVKPDYWIISDIVDGSGTHNLDMLYHPSEYSSYSDIISLDNLEREIKTEPIPIGSKYTKIFGSPYLSYSKKSSLPSVFSTMIYPHSQNFEISKEKLSVKQGSNLLPADKASGFKIDIKKNVMQGSISIKAKGQYCYGWPKMELRIDGKIVKELEMDKKDYMIYEIPVEFYSDNVQIDIVFPNDYAVKSKCDRNIYVDYIKVGDEIIQTENPSVVYDKGNGSAAFDEENVIPGQEKMCWGGALRMDVNISSEQSNQINYSDYFLISHEDTSKKEFGAIQFDGKLALLREQGSKIIKFISVDGTNLEYDSFKSVIENGKVYINTDSEIFDATICYPGIQNIYVNNKLTQFTKEDDCAIFSFADLSAFCNPNHTDFSGKCSTVCGASAGCEGITLNSCSSNSLKKCNSNCQEISSCGDGICNCKENLNNCPEDCKEETEPSLSADLNCDNRVGPADMAILLGNWGQDPSGSAFCQSPDINKDGNVGPVDFAVMMGQWNG